MQHLPCAAFVNESERSAKNAVDGWLRAQDGADTVYVLTNVTVPRAQGLPDEVDLVVIGPGGAVVVEVKHWDKSKLAQRADPEAAAELIADKARWIAGRLRAVAPALAFVPPVFLLTRGGGSLVQKDAVPKVLAVPVYGLKDVGRFLSVVARGTLSPGEVERMARHLAPRTFDAVDTVPRRFAHFDHLKLLSDPADRFHRIFSARTPRTGDRVILHCYDRSAGGDQDSAELRARREFDVMQRMQKSPWLPGFVDTWQALPNYAGEIYFFSLTDSSARSVASLAPDPAWGEAERLGFAVDALRALAELQEPQQGTDQRLIHRALNPEAVRVRAKGQPLFVGWRWARLPQAATITTAAAPQIDDPYAAPEVQSDGQAAATKASDVFSLCRVLAEVFSGESALAERARGVLDLGLAADPIDRPDCADLASELVALAAPTDAPEPPRAELWDENHPFEWQGGHYRVVAQLGKGAVGRTFKLEQLDRRDGASIGTFVGKVVLAEELGRVSLDAYKRVRSFARHPGLSPIFDTAPQWSPHQLMALLGWVNGEPLDGFRGELEYVVEMLDMADVETLVLGWFGQICAALAVLHDQGWCHGDVSATNILVDDGRLILIDYDLAGPVGTQAASPGTPPYSSPERRDGAPLHPSDDVFALAATLWHVLTDRAPDLGWTDAERAQWPRLDRLFGLAMHADPAARFADAAAALSALGDLATPATPTLQPPALVPQVIPRLREILQAYPGSRKSNVETRGLDTPFALETYVPSALDDRLARDARDGAVSLIILCGNAGDGKTAFLQHLMTQLGAPPIPSSMRVWSGTLVGRQVTINLDGAAAWQGRNADDLLDDLFAPFHHGLPVAPRLNLVAVNDGRLMEWAESYEARHGPTALTTSLADALNGDTDALPVHVKLIELNRRSLVGGVDLQRGVITPGFLDQMIDRLVGGAEAPQIWAACQTCTARARCSMRESAEIMGANPALEAEGALFRHRLAQALQAVHQRNEVHITARELKGALSYILFGLHDCEDLHGKPDLVPHVPADHAFDPDSPGRQGEVLRELTRLDPGLGAQARIDRYLARRAPPDDSHGAPRHGDDTRRTARRRAWFEWTDAQIQAVGGQPGALALSGGRHFADFRDFPLLDADRQGRIKRALCTGLSRLDSMPDIAFQGGQAVPIRLTARTATETAFWVEKSHDRFSLVAEKLPIAAGLETLHRSLILGYRLANGRVETLRVSLELFGRLIELAEGAQIIDAASDGMFANLSVFTQRLAQEDETAVLAWNPNAEAQVFALRIERRGGAQTVVIGPRGGE